MNILSIVLLIITALCVWRGFARGLFRSVLVAGAVILAMFLSALATPRVSAAICDYTLIDDKIESSIVNTLELNTRELITSKTEEMTAIDELHLPESLKMAIISNNNPDIYELLHINSFYEYIARYLTHICVNCLSFVIIQLSLTAVLLILLYSLEILKEIPILNGIDKVGGVLLGLVQALAIVWSIFVLIALLGNTAFGMQMYDDISGNIVLNYLFEHNLLLDTITHVTGL